MSVNHLVVWGKRHGIFSSDLTVDGSRPWQTADVDSFATALCKLLFSPEALNDGIAENSSWLLRVVESRLGIPRVIVCPSACDVAERRLALLTLFAACEHTLGDGVGGASLLRRRSSQHAAAATSPPADALQLAAVCAACSERPSLLERVVVDWRVWHRRCFVCDRCLLLLRPGAFCRANVEPQAEGASLVGVVYRCKSYFCARSSVAAPLADDVTSLSDQSGRDTVLASISTPTAQDSAMMTSAPTEPDVAAPTLLCEPAYASVDCDDMPAGQSDTDTGKSCSSLVEADQNESKELVVDPTERSESVEPVELAECGRLAADVVPVPLVSGATSCRNRRSFAEKPPLPPKPSVLLSKVPDLSASKADEAIGQANTAEGVSVSAAVEEETSDDPPIPPPRRKKLARSANSSRCSSVEPLRQTPLPADQSDSTQHDIFEQYPDYLNPFDSDDQSSDVSGSSDALNPFAGDDDDDETDVGVDGRRISSPAIVYAALQLPAPSTKRRAPPPPQLPGHSDRPKARPPAPPTLSPRRPKSRAPPPPPPGPHKRTVRPLQRAPSTTRWVEIVTERSESSGGELGSALADVDGKHDELEVRARALEMPLLFLIEQEPECWDEHAKTDEWLDVVRDKLDLLRREAVLVYALREELLDARHAEIEYRLRCLIEKPESEKSLSDTQEEADLLQSLLSVIGEKNALVESAQPDAVVSADDLPDRSLVSAQKAKKKKLRLKIKRLKKKLSTSESNGKV